MRYYERRDGPSQFEESYWSDKEDPDGVKRNMLEEKDRKVEDLKREIQFINKLDAGNVLDLGCGLGHVMTAFDRKHKIYGFEVSEFAADEARKNNPVRPDGPHVLAVQRLAQHPCGDVVIGPDVLQHESP